MIRPTSDVAQIRWLPCVNNSSSLEIPSFGLVRVVSVDTSGVLTVDRPNADGQDVMVNGPIPIPASGYGVVTWDDPVHVYYDTGDGTPAAGETWGAESGSYKANKSKAGFTILGGEVSERTVAIRPRGGSPFHFCRAYKSANQTFSTGSGGSLTWDSENYDTGSFHSTSSNTELFTAPVSGIYVATCAVVWVSNGTGQRLLTLVGNAFAGPNDYAQTTMDGFAAADNYQCVTAIQFLGAGTYVYASAAQTSGGDLDIDYRYSYFSICLIAAGVPT